MSALESLRQDIVKWRFREVAMVLVVLVVSLVVVNKFFLVIAGMTLVGLLYKNFGQMQSAAGKVGKVAWTATVFMVVFLVAQGVIGSAIGAPLGDGITNILTPKDGVAAPGWRALILNPIAIGANCLGSLILASLIALMYIKAEDGPAGATTAKQRFIKRATVVTAIFLFLAHTPFGQTVWGDAKGKAESAYRTVDKIARTYASTKAAQLQTKLAVEQAVVDAESQMPLQMVVVNPAAKLLDKDGNEVNKDGNVVSMVDKKVFVAMEEKDGKTVFSSEVIDGMPRVFVRLAEDNKITGYMVIEDLVKVEEAQLPGSKKPAVKLAADRLGGEIVNAAAQPIAAIELEPVQEKVGETYAIVFAVKEQKPTAVVPYRGEKVRFGPLPTSEDVASLVIQVGNTKEMFLEPIPFSGRQWVAEVTFPHTTGNNSGNAPIKIRTTFDHAVPVEISKVL